MKERCFILCRQSSGEADADESLSITVQEDECKALAKSKNIEIVKIFKEPACSGRLYPRGYETIASQDLIYTAWCRETKKTGQWRDGLGEVLKRLDEIQFIVCYDMTRFFRPLNGSFLGSLITQLLQTNGVKLLTLKEGIIDFQRFQDSLISSLTSQINSEQLRTQIEKSKAAYKRLRDNGEYYPGLMRMHGYKKTGRKLEVEIDQKEAEMVKTVFRLYNAAVPVNEIVRTLNTRYTDIFKAPCRRGIVTKMLSTPAYCGYQRDSSGELVKSKQLEGKEIISVDEWMTARKKLEANKTNFARPKQQWLPLSGLIFCGVCGGKMKSAVPRKFSKSSYVCFDHVRNGKAPCKTNITTTLDAKEGLGLLEVVKPLLLAEAMKQMNTAENDSEAKKKLSGLDLALAETKRKMKKLTTMWMDSLIEEEAYESAVKELKQRESEMLKQREKTLMELNRDTSQFDWVKLMMKFRGDGLSCGEYEMLVRLMIKKIVVYRDFIEVKTTYGDVEIPRQRIGRFNLCYRYDLQMKDKKAAIYFYGGEAAMHDASFWKDSKRTAMLGDVEIFLKD